MSQIIPDKQLQLINNLKVLLGETESDRFLASLHSYLHSLLELCGFVMALSRESLM